MRSVDEHEGSLTLDLASCNATYEVDVQESPGEIHIDVHQLTPTDPPGAECADSERVELADPVGQRAVIVNGDRFEID